MRNLNKIALTITVIALSMFCIQAHARDYHVSGKFCAQWQAKYRDSGGGEVEFATTKKTYHPAKFASAEVYDVTTSPPERLYFGQVDQRFSPESHTILDQDGCTSNLTLKEGHEYRFEVNTVVQLTERRRIYVQREKSATWTTSYSATSDNSGYEKYTATFQARRAGQYYFTYKIPRDGPTNFMPVLGKIVEKAKSGLFRWSPTFLGAAQGYGYILVRNGSPRYWDNLHVTYPYTASGKFVFGHELGHCFGDMTGGLHGSYNYYWRAQPSDSDCRCDHISTAVEDVDHCLQSLHDIRSAENEGFAHFFSTAIFNDRDAGGMFGYYKPVSDLNGQPCDAPPCWIDSSRKVKWRVTNCNYVPDTGTEWDWFTFFWGLWTDNISHRYSLDDIREVWRVVGDTMWRWDSLVAAVSVAAAKEENQWDQYKTQEFRDQGDYNGVDNQ